MRGKNGDGLTGLNEERFFGTKAFEFANDGVKAFPVARGLADAAVDDEILRALGYVGIEIVHEAAQGCFLLPAFAAEAQPRGARMVEEVAVVIELLPENYQLEDTTGGEDGRCSGFKDRDGNPAALRRCDGG